MRELDVVDQLSAVAKRRPLRAIPELTLLGIRQEQIVGLHQIGDEVAGFVHHPLRQTEPLLLRISIHALREEGDSKNRDKISIFL